MERISKEYSVKLNNGCEDHWALLRRESGLNAYGNKTSVVVYRNKGLLTCVDTRYDPTVADFGSWCREFIAAQYDPGYEPDITEIKKED